jgi:hypothetical protein
LKNEISGLCDEALAELASTEYLIDLRGRTMIEAKDSVKAKLGKSPDIAEAIMLELGEPGYEPFRYSGLPAYERSWPHGSSQTQPQQHASCQAQNDLDDMIGGPSTFIHSPEQMRMTSSLDGRDRVRWLSFGRRKAW